MAGNLESMLFDDDDEDEPTSGGPVAVQAAPLPVLDVLRRDGVGAANAGPPLAAVAAASPLLPVQLPLPVQPPVQQKLQALQQQPAQQQHQAQQQQQQQQQAQQRQQQQQHQQQQLQSRQVQPQQAQFPHLRGPRKIVLFQGIKLLMALLTNALPHANRQQFREVQQKFATTMMHNADSAVGNNAAIGDEDALIIGLEKTLPQFNLNLTQELKSQAISSFKAKWPGEKAAFMQQQQYLAAAAAMQQRAIGIAPSQAAVATANGTHTNGALTPAAAAQAAAAQAAAAAAAARAQQQPAMAAAAAQRITPTKPPLQPAVTHPGVAAGGAFGGKGIRPMGGKTLGGAGEAGGGGGGGGAAPQQAQPRPDDGEGLMRVTGAYDVRAEQETGGIVPHDFMRQADADLRREAAATVTALLHHKPGQPPWWSANVVDHRVAWSKLSDAWRETGVVVPALADAAGDAATHAATASAAAAGRLPQAPAGWRPMPGWAAGRGAAGSELCAMVSAATQQYMQKILSDLVALSWHRRSGLARDVQSAVEAAVATARTDAEAEAAVAGGLAVAVGDSAAAALRAEAAAAAAAGRKRAADWEAELKADLEAREEDRKRHKKSRAAAAAAEAAPESWLDAGLRDERGGACDARHVALLQLQRRVGFKHDLQPVAGAGATKRRKEIAAAAAAAAAQPAAPVSAPAAVAPAALAPAAAVQAQMGARQRVRAVREGLGIVQADAITMSDVAHYLNAMPTHGGRPQVKAKIIYKAWSRLQPLEPPRGPGGAAGGQYRPGL